MNSCDYGAETRRVTVMTIEADGWRVLTAGELAAEPDARFGGVIAVIFFAALFALTPLVFLAGVSCLLMARDAETARRKTNSA